MIRLLACAGADVNQASRNGISPFAAAGRSAAAVAFLAEVVGVTAVLRGAPDMLPNGGPEILLAAHQRLALALGLAARSSALQWLQDRSFDMTRKICSQLAFSRRNGPEAWHRHGQWQRLYNELNRRYAGWWTMHEHGREADPVYPRSRGWPRDTASGSSS